MFPLEGNIFPKLNKIVLHAKLCASTSTEYVFITGKIDFTAKKNVLRKIVVTVKNMFPLVGYMLPLLRTIFSTDRNMYFRQ